MALRIFGFPLVVLTAIGDMPFAAVPVIYPYVHFAPQSLQKSKPDKGWISPSPFGRLTGAFSKNPLYVLKVGAVDNRLMHIFRNLPLASVYIVVSLVTEMFCGLEVYNVAAILLPREDMGQRGFVPFATVFLVQRLIFLQVPRPRSFI